MTNAPDNLSQQRAQIRIALGGFAMLAFASTGVIARADKSPGNPRVSRWETDSDRSPPPRQRPWRHRLYAWMRHQELHHLLRGVHLRFDLLEKRLAWPTNCAMRLLKSLSLAWGT